MLAHTGGDGGPLSDKDLRLTHKQWSWHTAAFSLGRGMAQWVCFCCNMEEEFACCFVIVIQSCVEIENTKCIHLTVSYRTNFPECMQNKYIFYRFVSIIQFCKRSCQTRCSLQGWRPNKPWLLFYTLHSDNHVKKSQHFFLPLWVHSVM